VVSHPSQKESEGWGTQSPVNICIENALTRDEVHDPAERDGRAYEERKTVKAVANHLSWRFALGDAEDYGCEEREDHYRGKVRGPEH
jgi:hypothetical protein